MPTGRALTNDLKNLIVLIASEVNIVSIRASNTKGIVTTFPKPERPRKPNNTDDLRIVKASKRDSNKTVEDVKTKYSHLGVCLSVP